MAVILADLSNYRIDANQCAMRCMRTYALLEFYDYQRGRRMPKNVIAPIKSERR